MQIEIIFENESLIVVNKPQDIVTIPGNKMERKDSLVGMLENISMTKLYVVHRLDKGTSGAVIFAKTSKAHRHICAQFERREVIKKYWALVAGKCGFDQKEVSIPVSKAKSRSKKPALSSKGLDATTNIEVVKRFDEFTIVCAYPLTGRRHQIRLHLKAIGHPLAYDPLYANAGPVPLSIVTPQLKTSDLVIAGIPLHAGEISFKCPDTNAAIAVKAPLPEFFKLLLGRR